MRQVKSLHLMRYGVAVISVALAVILTLPLGQLATRMPFALFFAAVGFSAWYGGQRPGLLAIALGTITSAYFFLPPVYSLNIGLTGIIQLAVFLAVSLFIVLLTAARKRAEEAVRENEQWLSTMLNSIGDGVITTDGQGRVTFMNPVAQALTGWKQEEAKGRELKEVFHIVNEGTRQEVESPVTKVIRQGRVATLANHTLLITKDGREVPIDDSGAPIRDESGEIVGVILIFRDITEHEQAEKARARLAAIVESSDDVIIGKTLEGIIVSWNAGAERIYGYSAQETIGRPVTMLVPPDHADEVPHILEIIKHGEGYKNQEAVRRRKDGTLINVSLTVSPVKDSAGNVVGASTIARDITESKRAEEALRASEERHRAFVAQSAEAIWRYELDQPVPVDLPEDEQINLFYEYGSLAECNDVMARMYGYRDANEIVGARLSDLLVRSNPENEAFLRAFIRSGHRVSDAESYELDKDGHPKYFLNNLVGIIEGGALLRVWGTQRDITERKAAEEERDRLLAKEQEARAHAEEANRAKDEFLATLSHELRTPLTAMLGWTRMLRTRELDETTSAHALETIERNVRAQAQLIEDLLDVSRIITGKLRLDVSPVELMPVIEAALDSVRPAADAKLIQLQTALDPLTGLVSGDAARLQQVVWNLVSNAVKFTSRGGRVEVRLGRVESHVEISVSDTGQGINQEFLPHVFDRFRQADSSTTRVHGGLGLGLAIVRHLVELHGGTVYAESAGEGHGSTFKVELPLRVVSLEKLDAESLQHGHALTAPLDVEPTLDDLHVLLVDDEQDARELLVTVLERCGASVVAVATAGEALAALAERRPDILISDIGMPGEDGYDLIRKVRLLTEEQGGGASLPAVALTAYAGQEDRQRALEAGFQMHLSKPVDPGELAAAISSLFRSADKV